MKLRLADQSSCGILDSLIARLLLENELKGLAILLHALRYLNDAAIPSCWAPYQIAKTSGALSS
jgi:hypothetical protein